MRIGCHVSVGQGYEQAVNYAEQVGAECMQIFAKSPRQWRGGRLDEAAAESFRLLRDERDFGPVFTHTAYLINLSTNNEELREKSIAALTDELVRGAVLGVDGVVTHVGNDPGEDWRAAAQRAAESILAAYRPLHESGASVRLLLENTAGAGSSFGARFGQLGTCIEFTGMAPELLGMCLDTCHAFAYGYELDIESGWRGAVDELAGAVGLERLGLIHANDCMFERGSKRDRHAWIGDGLVGIDGFRAMICSEALAHVPVVTEMSGDKPVKDSANIDRLKALRDRCGGQSA